MAQGERIHGGGSGGPDTGRPQPWVDPEIALLEAELAALSETLVAAEADLLETRVRVERFTLAHDRRMAPLYAELADVEAQIAELRAHDGHPEHVRTAQDARARARDSASAAEEARAGADDSAGNGEPVAVPEAVRALFRRLARRCHPDLADDETDRGRREDFMRRVNAAYARGDQDMLRRLELEWLAEGENAATPPEGSQRMDCLRAAVAAARRRLAQVQSEHAVLVGGVMGRILFDPRHGGDQGQALDELARTVRERIRLQRGILERLQADHG